MKDVLGVDNVIFPVGDLDEARALYSDDFGFVEAFAFPEIGMVGYAIGDETPGLIIRATGAAKHGAGVGPSLLLEVRDARAAYEELADRVELPEPLYRMHTGYAFEYVDPWGNRLGFADYAFAPEKGRPAATPDR